MSRSFGIGTSSRFFEWRMFLAANRYPLRRNMRSSGAGHGLGTDDTDLASRQFSFDNSPCESRCLVAEAPERSWLSGPRRRDQMSGAGQSTVIQRGTPSQASELKREA